MNRVIRFIDGDRPAQARLGRCDAHEHVALGGPFIAQAFPDLDLSDEDASVQELRSFAQAGGGWVVDAMPTGPGRQPLSLAEVSRRSGVPVVMSTGRHLSSYYPPGDPHLELEREALCRLFVSEIEQGVAGYRCGLIKVAAGAGALNDSEREAFIAAAQAQRITGCAILTHTEADAEGAWAQVRILQDHGASLNKVVLSHLDKNPDPVLHRDLLQAGVRVEYDQHFRRLRQQDSTLPNPFDFIAGIVTAFPDAVLLGMDLARRTYWVSRGGGPGLVWLLVDLVKGLERAGLTTEQIDRCLIDNALSAFCLQHMPQPAPDSSLLPTARFL